MRVDDLFVAYTGDGDEGARVLIKQPEGSNGIMLVIVQPDGTESSAILHHPWAGLFMAAYGHALYAC